MKYCSKPFEELEIDVDGNCYCCCRWWNNSYCFGNIFTQSIEEIWNGQAAQELRKSVLEGDYKYCNINECLTSHNPDIEYSCYMKDYPLEISLCYDYTCTAQCVFCNDKIKKMSDIEAEKWDNLIKEKLIPLFKNAKFVRLSMVGELFVSEHSKKLVKEIAKTYPNIKFEIVSNGIFASKENIENLGIEDKLYSVKFSLPSMKQNTYKKLVKNGDLNKVKKNLEYISELKKQGKINNFLLNFIICSINYKELPYYSKQAKRLGAVVDCLLLDRKDESTDFLRNYDLYNVADEKHPEYNKFINIITSKNFKKYTNVNINSAIMARKKVSLSKRITNTINYYKLKFSKQK